MDKATRKKNIEAVMDALQQVGDYATLTHPKQCACSVCKIIKSGTTAVRLLFKEVSPEGGTFGRVRPPKIQIHH